MRALIAGISLAAIAVVGAPGLAGASPSGSLGNGSAGGVLGGPVTLTYDELGDGHARGTLSSRGGLADCVVGVTSDKSTADAIARGDKPISDLSPTTTRDRGGQIFGINGDQSGGWRMQSNFSLNPDTSIYAVGQCIVQGETVSATATYGGGPGSGSLDLGSLGS